MAALPALVPPLNAVADVRAPGGMGATGIIQTGSQALVPRSTTPLYLIGMDDADTLSDLGDGALFGNPCLCVCRSTDPDEGDDFPYTAEDFLLPQQPVVRGRNWSSPSPGNPPLRRRFGFTFPLRFEETACGP